MHQRTQRGSMARAASAPPMSSVSHPNAVRIPVAVLLAAASLPAMNMDGFPPLNPGFTMQAAPTQLNAFTKCAAPNSRCNRSMSDSSKLVKSFRSPFSGGASAIGLVASITVFPARIPSPAMRRASAATEALPRHAKGFRGHGSLDREHDHLRKLRRLGKAADSRLGVCLRPVRQLGGRAGAHCDLVPVL